MPFLTNMIASIKTHYGKLLLGILALEAALITWLPTDVLVQLPWMGALVDGVQAHVPSIAAFDNPAFPENGAVRLYMSIALLLMPLKILCFYLWIDDKAEGVKKHLVVSPTTETRPADGEGFVTDPLHEEMGAHRLTKPRSMLSRVFWSFLILLITLIAWWMIYIAFERGDPADGGITSRDFRNLAYRHWLGAWYGWSLSGLSFTAFLSTVSIFVIQGTLVAIKDLVLRFFRR